MPTPPWRRPAAISSSASNGPRRTLRHARDQLTALVEIQRAVAGHLERKALFMAVADALQGVISLDRVVLLLPGSDPATLTVYAASGKTGIQFYEGETIPRVGTIAGWVVDHGRSLVVGRADEIRQRFPSSHARLRQEGMDSVVVVPLLAERRCVGALALMAQVADALAGVSPSLLEQIAAAVAVAVDHCVAYEELQSLRDRLARENVYLQEEIRREHPFEELVGSSAALLAILRQVEQVAPTDTTVLLHGETGTGKEVIARAIPNSRAPRAGPSSRSTAPPSRGLVESELFGHVQGAFTGAPDRRVGRFGWPTAGRSSSTRSASSRSRRRRSSCASSRSARSSRGVGRRSGRCSGHRGDQSRSSKTRFTRDASGRDLYYRLAVVNIDVPALRERPGDIPQLVTFFLSGFVKKFGKRITSISPETMARLTGYAWPGNIRELQNIVERAIVLCDGPVLELDQDLAPVSGMAPAAAVSATPGAAREAPRDASPGAAAPREPSPSELPTLEEAERRHIVAALEHTGGVIHGPRGAARILDLHPNTLRSRMERLGIKVPRARHEPS